MKRYGLYHNGKLIKESTSKNELIRYKTILKLKGAKIERISYHSGIKFI